MPEQTADHGDLALEALAHETDAALKGRHVLRYEVRPRRNTARQSASPECLQCLKPA